VVKFEDHFGVVKKPIPGLPASSSIHTNQQIRDFRSVCITSIEGVYLNCCKTLKYAYSDFENVFAVVFKTSRTSRDLAYHVMTRTIIS